MSLLVARILLELFVVSAHDQEANVEGLIHTICYIHPCNKTIKRHAAAMLSKQNKRILFKKNSPTPNVEKPASAAQEKYSAGARNSQVQSESQPFSSNRGCKRKLIEIHDRELQYKPRYARCFKKQKTNDSPADEITHRQPLEGVCPAVCG